MDEKDEALEAWEQRLRLAEDELRQREQAALAHDPSPAVLLALAAEHDKIALDRDSIASGYDDLASGRDVAGLDRDVFGSERDRRARSKEDDRDAGFADRSISGDDRDFAAGDRGDSVDDRSRARHAREQASDDRTRAGEDRDRAAEKAESQDVELAGLRSALETRSLIGQAQGWVMGQHKVSSDEAFAILVRLSQHSNTKLRDVAVRVIEAAQPEVE